MTRNDTFYKILFAIQLALIPLVLAAYYLMEDWTVGLFIAASLGVKIWLELFRTRENTTHKIISAVGNVLTLATLIIFFAAQGYLSVVLCVFAVIFVVLMNILSVCLHGKTMPETIEAVDFCYMLFECFVLVGMTFVVFNQLITNIGLFAILLTAVVSVAYKVYYVVKCTDFVGRVKSLFRKK